jgi:pimeloyl-ACP methyl ester carboxylesterase
VATISDAARPPRWRLGLEVGALAARIWRSFGSLAPRGPENGPKLMVIPGFVATDRTTLGLQRALAGAGWRVTGWGLGMNSGVKPDTRERIVEQILEFGGGAPVRLVGWSLGGVYAREVAKLRPDLVTWVATLGSPFSGDPRSNNVWRLYEWVAGHPVDDPPIDTILGEKPPVPTLAIWSRRDGIVSVAAARGEIGESDRQVELGCSHMGFGVSGRAYPDIVAALRAFER